MPRYVNENGIKRQMTAEEEAQRDIEEQTWLEEKAEYNDKMNEMANEPEQSDYAQQRRNSYPEIGDQLDMLWHSIDQNPSLKSEYFDFYEAIKAVKVKYPKNG